jgi:hypothetical protein
LVITDTPTTFIPAWRATMASGAVDMPTASAPSTRGGADFGRRLEARAAKPDVDAGMKADAERLRGRAELLQQHGS